MKVNFCPACNNWKRNNENCKCGHIYPAELERIKREKEEKIKQEKIKLEKIKEEKAELERIKQEKYAVCRIQLEPFKIFLMLVME